MLKQINNILFATNLSESSRRAFNLAATLAMRFKSTIVLLHVMEKMPDHLEVRLRKIFGETEWKEMINAKEYNAWEALIGKKSTNLVIREALEQFCLQEGIDDASCGYNSREIVISNGEVVDDIIATSEKYDCDLIILGASRGLVSNNAIGSKIKSILRKTRIPAMIAPPPRGNDDCRNSIC